MNAALHEHLDELRKRLIISLVAVLIGSGIVYSQIDKTLSWILSPLKGPVQFLHPAQGFVFTWQIILIGGSVLASPVILTQVWLFVGAAFEERRTVLKYALCSLVLLLGTLTAAFGIILPLTLDFFLSYQSPQLIPAVTLEGYTSFVFGLCLAAAVLSQVPILAYVAAREGIISKESIRKYSAHLIIGAFLVAAIITPTTDAVTLLLVALPLVIAMKIGLFLGAR